MTLARTLGFIFAAGAALVAAASIAAAQSYPSKPIRLIVPYAPGGAAGILARVAADRMTHGLGQPIIVDHRPGAGTIIGVDLAAKAAPDGYTLVMGTVTSHAMVTSLSTNVPFDPEKDFAPISLIASLPFILVVHPSVPAASVAELVALAKARPGQLNYGSAGNGTSNHLAGELFKSAAGLDMVHIPYRGSGPAMLDLVGGQIPLMFDLTITALPQIAGGKVRALAITSARRSALAPALPTMAEAGAPGVEVVSWFGILAPAGTPPAIVTRLNAEIVKAMQAPDVKELLAGQGADALTSTPQEFAAYISAERAKWARVVREAGIKPE
ncbi:MAG: tripartite tricarboxylate transporter substrate binding protein [Proteobacteria bacterium]|nr:tripartite tricarboxylate transporter substrate binding protein [Pseudomonadota bacterium]